MNVKKSRRRSLRILKSTTTSCEDGADCGVIGGSAEVFGSAWLADTAPQRGRQDCAPLDVGLKPGTDECSSQNYHLHVGTGDCSHENVSLPAETDVCAHPNVRLQPGTDDSGPLCDHLKLGRHEYVPGNIHLKPAALEQTPLKGHLQVENQECTPQKGHRQVETHECTPLNDHLQVETHECTPLIDHLQVETHECIPLKSHLKVESHECIPSKSDLNVVTDKNDGQNVHGQVETPAPLNIHLQSATAGSDTPCDRCQGDERAPEDVCVGDRLTGDRQTLGHLQQCQTSMGGSIGPVFSEGITGKDGVITGEMEESLNKGFLCGGLSPGFDISSPALGENRSFQSFSSPCNRSGQDERVTAVPCVVDPDSRDVSLIPNGELNVHASSACLNTEQSNASSIDIVESENLTEMLSSEMPSSENSFEVAKASQCAEENTRKEDADTDVGHILTPEECPTDVIPAPSLTSSASGILERQERLAPGRDKLEMSLYALESKISKRLVSELDEFDTFPHMPKSNISLSGRLTPELDEHATSLLVRKSEMSALKRMIPEVDASLHAVKADISMSKRQGSEMNEYNASLRAVQSEMSVLSPVLVPGRDGEAKTCAVNKLNPSMSEAAGVTTTSDSLKNVTAVHGTGILTECHPTAVHNTDISTEYYPTAVHDADISTEYYPTAVHDADISTEHYPTAVHETGSSTKYHPTAMQDTGISTEYHPTAVDNTGISTEYHPTAVDNTGISTEYHPTAVDNTGISTEYHPTAVHDTGIATVYHPSKSTEIEEMNSLIDMPLFTEQRPNGIKSRGSKTDRKSKKQRRRSAFGAEFHLESSAEEKAASNLESSCAEVALDRDVDTDLAVRQGEETQLASNLTRVEAKKRKSRSVDVCVVALDCGDATESTSTEASVENKCSASKQRRSSLRLYRQQSTQKRKLNAGSGTENERGEKKESHGLLEVADKGNSAQRAAQADGDIVADELYEDDGTVSSELKQLYCNKNYKEPASKTWETIFEVPSKGKLVSKKKQKRYVLFEDRIPMSKLKHRSKKAAQNGWNVGSLVLTKTDQDVEEKLKQLDKEVLDIH